MPLDVQRAIARIRTEIAKRGLLLLHDKALPSVTTLVAGAPVSGSWWGHAAGPVIWEALQVIDDEVASAKLVAGKVTFIHARLWPALAAVGSERADWQWHRLGDAERALVDELDDAGQLRSDERLAQAPPASRKALKRAIDRAERRLLVYTEQIHAESGKHARVLTSWSHFVKARALTPPAPSSARHELQTLVHGWPPPKGKRLLPW